MKAMFTLEDEAGQVRLTANFEGGFDAKSPAHAAGAILIGQMDKMQDTVVEPQPAPKLVLVD